MSASSISFRMSLFGSIGIAAAALYTPAFSANGAPDSDNGRYSFSQTTDGVLRLDTRMGGISICTNKSAGWTCYAVPDERAALDAEIGRLQAENDRLKAEIARQSKADGPTAKDGDGKRGNKLELQLPDDRDIDRVVSFLERAWRKLLEMAGRVQKDVSGKI
jgi:hypothetical protein